MTSSKRPPTFTASARLKWKRFQCEVSMVNSHDNITVGNITLVYSGKHHGWITPYNEVIKNPLKAQRTAERINSNLKLSLAANGLAA
ncbi:TPA: DUF1317 family protein [Yersinia enterocolitica]